MPEQLSKKVLIKDVMTKKVVSVSPETSIFDAVKIISDHKFDGLPVIDKDNNLVGIVTEYDLIMSTSTVNLSFLQNVLNEVYTKKAVKGEAGDGKQEISSLRVSDVMNKEPLTLSEDASFEDMIEAFAAHHRVNPIPIINIDNKVVGIVSRFDVLRPLNLLGYGVLKK